MNYARDQLFALRPNGGNTICLAMPPYVVESIQSKLGLMQVI